MIGIINGNAIQHDQVLVRRTAADVEGAGKIIQGLYSRQHLHSSKKVRLYKSWSHFQCPDIQTNSTGFHQLAHFLNLTKNIHRFSFQDCGPQAKIQALVLASKYHDAICNHLKTDNGDSDLLLTCWYTGYDKIPFHIGSPTDVGVLNKHVSVPQWLAAGIISNEATYS